VLHSGIESVLGRLSRSLWTRPTRYPASLKRFRIIINETGPHHSWTTDHLSSLHNVPLHSLEEFSIVRREASPKWEDGAVPSYDFSPLDEALALKPVPRHFVDSLKEAAELRRFECDWWSWNVSDLKVVLENCPKLEVRFV
jgi:hypothetical protein